MTQVVDDLFFAHMFEEIDHVGIAVENIDDALDLYTKKLGMKVLHREAVEGQGVDAVLLDCGLAHVELLAPLGPETTTTRFLERRGPGLHHVAYRVADIDAVLADLKEQGLELIDAEPRVGIANSRAAFVHPKSVGGVLTEIVQPAADHDH